MKKIIIAVVAAVILAVGGYLILHNSSGSGGLYSNSNGSSTQPAQTQSENSSGQPAQSAAIVTYTDNGFSPASLTIQKGQTVTFKNDSSQSMWVASNVHPIHSGYDGTSLSEHCANPTDTTFDACQGYSPGSSYTFTFTKTGTWGYHNHLSSGDTGTIVVE